MQLLYVDPSGVVVIGDPSAVCYYDYKNRKLSSPMVFLAGCRRQWLLLL